MIIGVDYARVDGNAPPDFVAWKAACVAAGSSAGVAIFRGAYGTSPDSTVRRDWNRAKDAGLTCGSYLLLRMHAAQPPEPQCHAFADNVGSLTVRDLVPILDVEDTGEFTAAQELEWLHRAWTEMKAIYGAPPMIYDSARVWHEDLHDLPAGEMTDSPQWVAKPWPWPVHTPAQLSPAPFAAGKLEPPVPGPWGEGNWWLHQYQGDAFPAAGFTNTVDLSRFNVMRSRAIGDRVSWVQRRLGMPENGWYGETTISRVREYQRANGLVDDGEIGPKTFALIAWTMTSPRPAQHVTRVA